MNKVFKIKLVGETDGKVVEDRELVIPVGRGYLLKGIDESLKKKKVRDEYELTLKPEEAYGKRSGDLIKLIPLRFFKKDNINPYPGLIINIDGMIGKVRSVSPGRVLVDFNHPLAGKTLKFKIKVLKKLINKARIAQEITKAFTGIECKAKVMDKKIQVIISKELPKEFSEKISNEVKEVTGSKTEVLTKKA